LELTARLFVALVVGLAGISKARRPWHFARSISAYRLVPETFSKPLALAIPSLEIVSAACLGFGYLRQAAGFVLVVLMAGFIWAISVNLIGGRQIDCGCSGQPRPIGWSLVFQDLVIALVALWIALGTPWVSQGSQPPMAEAMNGLLFAASLLLAKTLTTEVRKLYRLRSRLGYPIGSG
jgi:uncharacterized membrane protein YphA (DoxX/SURF4 family)